MKKRRLELFQINDYEAIEKHLIKMAQKGWFLESIGTFFWTYRKGEPQNLTYEVTYFYEASDFNPYPTDSQEAYYEYCRAAGWTLVAAKDKLQVFSSDKEKPTPIETDENLKFQSIHKSMKKSMFLTCGMLLLLSLLIIIISVIIFKIDSIVYFISDTFYLPLYSIFPLLVAIYLLIDYTYWYYGTKKALALGNEYGRNHHKVRKIAAIAMITIPMIMVISIPIAGSSKFYCWTLVIAIAFLTAIILMFTRIKALMKKAGVSRRKNILVTSGVGIITVVLCNGFMFWGIFALVDSGAFNKRADSSYSFTDSYGKNNTFHIYKDSLPLTLEDMYVVIDNKHYSYEIEEKDNFALSYIRGTQKAPVYLKSSPSLYYELYKIKLPSLYNSFKKGLLERYEDSDGYSFVRVSASTWESEEVYQLTMNETLYDIYFICYEDEILVLILNFTPLEEQIEVIREKLIGDNLQPKYTLNKEYQYE